MSEAGLSPPSNRTGNIHTFDTICAPVDRVHGLSAIRQHARRCITSWNLNPMARAEILTIINELGNNILHHGGEGRICITPAQINGHLGFRIIAEDTGPGISSLGRAGFHGHSRGKGLGLGLKGIERMANDLRIASRLPKGTYVEVWKWVF